MQIINIDKRVYEQLFLRFYDFRVRIEELCGRYSDKELPEWLDSQEVCIMLNISPRTLQSYRDNGRISFSQIGHKIYYKPEDIKRFVDKVYKNRHSKRNNHRKKNF